MSDSSSQTVTEQCPRCKSTEAIYLFAEDRFDKKGEAKYQYTWTYLECCGCHMIRIESEINNMKWGKTWRDLANDYENSNVGWLVE